MSARSASACRRRRAPGSGLSLRFGLGVLMEGIVGAFRAVNTNSRVVWTHGTNGQVNRHSDLFDSWQGGSKSLGKAGRNQTGRH